MFPKNWKTLVEYNIDYNKETFRNVLSLFFDFNYEWQTKISLFIYAMVTLNVRICIGFNVILVACDDTLSKNE
jgi:hypothetical protein